MKFAALALTILTPMLFLGQTPSSAPVKAPTCPIEIAGNGTSVVLPQAPNTLWVQVYNRTDKIVYGVKMTLYTMNAVYDIQEYPYDIVLDVRMKPGKGNLSEHHIIPLDNYKVSKGFALVLDKVVYRDGTAWVDTSKDHIKCDLIKKY